MRADLLAPSHSPEHLLWQKLARYNIGPDGAALSFTDRLARENGWTQAYASAVVHEYYRFCFLAVTAGHQVTPSDAVDQAWHLHLTYSMDYWERFCPEVLGRKLHHGPTAGGEGEAHRFFEQYARTLKSYEAAFGLPPEEIWPSAVRRAREDGRARRVHPRDAVIIPKNRLVFIWMFVAFAVTVLVCLSAGGYINGPVRFDRT